MGKSRWTKHKLLIRLTFKTESDGKVKNDMMNKHVLANIIQKEVGIARLISDKIKAKSIIRKWLKGHSILLLYNKKRNNSPSRYDNHEPLCS